MLFVMECMLWLPSERGGLHRQFAVHRSILVCDVMPAYRSHRRSKHVGLLPKVF